MTQKQTAGTELDQVLQDLLRREEELCDAYSLTLGLVGDDARVVLANIRRRHAECITEIHVLQDELLVQRELTGAIAD